MAASGLKGIFTQPRAHLFGHLSKLLPEVEMSNDRPNGLLSQVYSPPKACQDMTRQLLAYYSVKCGQNQKVLLNRD